MVHLLRTPPAWVRTRFCLSESHVEDHHQGETEHQTQRGQVHVTGVVRLRDELFDDHENHCAGGESERVGQNRGGLDHGCCADNRKYRLYKT